MFKKILILFFLSFVLLSCGQQRDIFNEETAKNFIPQNIESPFFGNPSSKLQLTVFADFQCPACIYFEKMIGEKLFTDYTLTNKIGITYKNFPLNIHINAPEDALASMCAHEQNKYENFAVKMFALEEEKKGIVVTKEDRQSIAKAIGLDMTKFDRCVLEGRYVGKIKQDMSDGEKIGLQGTPSIYANGKLIEYNSPESFFAIVDGLLK